MEADRFFLSIPFEHTTAQHRITNATETKLFKLKTLYAYRKGGEYHIFSISQWWRGVSDCTGWDVTLIVHYFPTFLPLSHLTAPFLRTVHWGLNTPRAHVRRQDSVATSVLNPFVILLTVAISMNQSHVRLSHSKSIVEMPNKTSNSYRVKAPGSMRTNSLGFLHDPASRHILVSSSS